MKFGSSNNKVHEMILQLKPPQLLFLFLLLLLSLFSTQPSFTTFEQNLMLHLHVFLQLTQLQRTSFQLPYHLLPNFVFFFSLLKKLFIFPHSLLLPQTDT
uniref:Uncharacterized protein n=1 Tax=Octopus bimaculoides TaxID=37653 RepID=A0A0L8HCT0_OCTBM